MTEQHKNVPHVEDSTLCCAACGLPLRREEGRVKDNALVHHLCPPPCRGYENGCRCDDCIWSDMSDPRSNGFITWDEA